MCIYVQVTECCTYTIKRTLTNKTFTPQPVTVWVEKKLTDQRDHNTTTRSHSMKTKLLLKIYIHLYMMPGKVSCCRVTRGQIFGQMTPHEINVLWPHTCTNNSGFNICVNARIVVSKQNIKGKDCCPRACDGGCTCKPIDVKRRNYSEDQVRIRRGGEWGVPKSYELSD